MISEKLKKRKPLDTNRRRRRRRRRKEGAGSVNRPRKGAVGSIREGKREEQKKDKRDPLNKRRERNVSNQVFWTERNSEEESGIAVDSGTGTVGGVKSEEGEKGSR
jgi:hypothetical protein